VELQLVDVVRLDSRAIRAGLREARSRQELVRETCAVILEMALTGTDEGAAIVLRNPLLTLADVQSVFDEISETFYVTGIDLSFDEQDGGRLRAIFAPSGERRSGGAVAVLHPESWEKSVGGGDAA
jgi:hypothetical protein